MDRESDGSAHQWLHLQSETYESWTIIPKKDVAREQFLHTMLLIILHSTVTPEEGPLPALVIAQTIYL